MPQNTVIFFFRCSHWYNKLYWQWKKLHPCSGWIYGNDFSRNFCKKREKRSKTKYPFGLQITRRTKIWSCHQMEFGKLIDWQISRKFGARNFRGKLDYFKSVWEFHVFSEINFGEFWSTENAVFAILEAVNFANLVIFSLEKVLKFIKH